MSGINHIWRRYLVIFVILVVIAYCKSFTVLQVKRSHNRLDVCLIYGVSSKMPRFADKAHSISGSHPDHLLDGKGNFVTRCISFDILKCALLICGTLFYIQAYGHCGLKKKCKGTAFNPTRSSSSRKPHFSLGSVPTGLEDLYTIFILNLDNKRAKTSFKDQSWMYDVHRMRMASLPEYLVYPTFHLLASYVPLSRSGAYNWMYYFIELAETGFMYTGEGEVVRCTGCGQTVDLPNITSDPRSSVYHRDTCRFYEGSQRAVERQDAVDGGQSLADRSFLRGGAGPGTCGRPEHSALPDSPNEAVVHQNVGVLRPGNLAEDTGNPTIEASSDLAGASAVPLEGLLSLPSERNPVSNIQSEHNQRQTASAGPQRQHLAGEEVTRADVTCAWNCMHAQVARGDQLLQCLRSPGSSEDDNLVLREIFDNSGPTSQEDTDPDAVNDLS